MKLQAVCEYNNKGCLIYCVDFPGAYVRGENEQTAMAKFHGELRSFLRWSKLAPVPLDAPEIEIVQRKLSDLQVCDADSDVLFDAECLPLTQEEYERLKLLVLKSARDFRKLYRSIPNPDISDNPPRMSFYGAVPRTPHEMYDHTNQVTAYYAGAFGVELDNVPDIYDNRLHVFSELELLPDLFSARLYTAPDGESWTLRKGLRRFLWHDRIHAKAMWRTASKLWGSEVVNPFYFV